MIFVVAVIYILTTSLCWSEVLSIKNSKNLPQAIIIGVKKCGTRALLKFLSTHSAIAASSREIHFFDSSKHFQQGLQWYRYVNREDTHINEILTIYIFSVGG